MKRGELITYENKRGIYGVAFKSINIENPEIIKGSEVGLSWQDVNLKINSNSQVSVKEIIVEDIPKDIDIEENNYYLPYIPGNAIHIKGQESEDFSTLKKKKKGKGQGRSNENNRGRGM